MQLELINSGTILREVSTARTNNERSDTIRIEN